MSLLREESQAKPAIKPKPQRVVNPFSLTKADGWNFGVGFAAAMILAAPLILAGAACVAWVAIAILGIGAGIIGG